jgi:hypothetical protein
MDPRAKEIEPLQIGNYCVCFLDFPGQRELLKGEGLMPSNRDEAHAKFQTTLTAVRKLHEYAVTFLGENLQDNSVGLQRWSDGVVVYTALGGPNEPRATDSVHSLFTFAAAMLIFGLAAESPLRGGIEISWGVELYEGELYGPAVANAYLLESETAKYPRIVVGPRVLTYLQSHSADTRETEQSRLNRGFAQECISMLSSDEDDCAVLNYFGWVLTNQHILPDEQDLIRRARVFVTSQLQSHTDSGNEKLRVRYEWLSRYLSAQDQAHA